MAKGGPLRSGAKPGKAGFLAFVNHDPAPCGLSALAGESVMPLNRNALPLVFAATLIAAGMSMAPAQSVRHQSGEPRQTLFVITDQEGYGTAECLEKQGGCGKIIADSFCESKGFRMADFHRKAAAEEITGSIASERRPPPRDPQAFVISCK
jgi:hypothetical protein